MGNEEENTGRFCLISEEFPKGSKDKSQNGF